MKRTLLACLLLLSTAAFADTSFLKPPEGTNVALWVFEDMQCPTCARVYPLVTDAAKKYDIPLLLRDFPLGPTHPWSFDAAVLARYFDTINMGNDFRAYIYKNQPAITRDNVRSYAERFAAANKVSVPFVIDPKGELAAKVRADKQLGDRIPLAHTPTIYVVSNKATGPGLVEVDDYSQLFTIIEQAKREAIPLKPAAKTPAKAPAKSAAKPKTAAKK